MNIESMQFAIGLAPVADALSGTVYSDVVSLKNYKRAIFRLCKAVGATGTSTITVQACDDTTPSNRVAIPFKYKKSLSGDSFGALTDAADTGFATTAGENDQYVIEVEDRDLPSGYPYVQIKSVEVVDDPCVADISIILTEPKFAQASMIDALT